MMKEIVIAVAALFFSVCASAQSKDQQIHWPEYKFTVELQNPVTPVKNQYRSGTCWCFSTLGFIESEIIRINGIKDEADYPDLSEMFVVSHSYMDRADKYVRVDGQLGFAAGSEADDALHIIKDYGMVPQNAMPGFNYGTELPVHGEIDAILKAYVGAVVKNPNKTLSTAWKRGFQAVLDEYFGECPETFTVNGKTYTPQSYRDALNVNVDDYVTLTSFTHHPFYSRFALELSDNWRWDEAYNLPLDEYMSVIDNALISGYTLAWGADVSHPGFSRNRGLAILVDVAAATTEGSDMERWTGKEGDRKQERHKAERKPADRPLAEASVTQESRQQGFDNKTTTDDHGMQIYGLARDQWGGKYYIVKNSWGEAGKFKGIWYVSEAYVMNQSMDIVVHKDAVPQALKDKLGIK
ncbi:MAG: aminopeptidase [Bacteroidales bacterium]|nr:aminopeptidase [Bacteroidales bacterium]